MVRGMVESKFLLKNINLVTLAATPNVNKVDVKDGLDTESYQ